MTIRTLHVRYVESGKQEMRLPDWKLWSLLLLLFVRPTLSAEQVATTPVIMDIGLPRAGRVGEALPLTVVFTNAGADPLYVEFGGANYGPDSLVVCAFDGNQWFHSGRAHFDRDVAAHRFDFIPLRS